jgi:hypothetical protein
MLHAQLDTVGYENHTIKRTFRAIHKVLVQQAVRTKKAINFDCRRHYNMQPISNLNSYKCANNAPTIEDISFIVVKKVQI